MIGAIAGDVIGSVYEGARPMPKTFPLLSTGSRFTDDSVLTVAIASPILHGGDYGTALNAEARTYPYAGYGSAFLDLTPKDDDVPYNSYGNAAGMRVSAAGRAFNDLDRVPAEAEQRASPSDNHPQGQQGNLSRGGRRAPGAYGPTLRWI